MQVHVKQTCKLDSSRILCVFPDSLVPRSPSHDDAFHCLRCGYPPAFGVCLIHIDQSRYRRDCLAGVNGALEPTPAACC